MNGLSRGHRDAEYTNFQPRMGLAWQFMPRTVITRRLRHFVSPDVGHLYFGLDRAGFSLNTPLVSSVDGGFHSQ